MTVERPIRRFPRYGTMLAATAFVLVAAAVMTFWSPYYQEQVAVDVVYERGGEIDGLKKSGPDWLRKQLGDKTMQMFDRVTAVHLSDRQVNDDVLAHVGAMTKVRELHLSRTQFSETGLQHLRGMLDLDELWLNCSAVTDAGMEHLGRLPQLRKLWLNNTRVSDAGLEHLGRLTQLQQLWLFDTNVTQTGVEKLHKLLPDCTIEFNKETKMETTKRD